MRLNVHVVRFPWTGGPAQFRSGMRDIAEATESSGAAGLSFMDHYLNPPGRGPTDEPMLEGYATLAYVAALTSVVHLRLLVTGVTYRHPALLAKIIATLDVLSGGRAGLGLGAAWYGREHRALGVPFPPLSERFERLEEAIQICLQMWGPDNGPFRGRHYRLRETLCSPEPLSRPHPAVLIGGGGERKTLALVARYADACNVAGGTRTTLRQV
jgi:F420-dependent oxidoreductase-like protein